jgi:hypothetical protein
VLGPVVTVEVVPGCTVQLPVVVLSQVVVVVGISPMYVCVVASAAAGVGVSGRGSQDSRTYSSGQGNRRKSNSKTLLFFH